MSSSTNQTSRQLAAIVFSDVVDFTKTMSKDEKLGLKYIKNHSLAIKGMIEEHGGELLKELGDGCLLIFNSSYNAVMFSKKLQEEILKKYDFKIRIGIHVGDIIKEKNDYFGSGVNIASRIYAFAKPSQICITQDVNNQIKSQRDFNTKSIGKKDIKGISEQIRIYAIEEQKIETKQPSTSKLKRNTTLFAELISRRVPQFIGVYGAVAWTIIQFVDWIIDRYHYSPYLVDLALAVMISMIPSILILAYFHGAPGKDKWTKVEKIGIPINIIASVLLIMILFYPKDLGAITTIIEFKDENGKISQKIIPKAEFRKNLLIYNLNVNHVEDYSWLSYGTSEGIKYDLNQDIYMSAKTQSDYRWELDKYNKDIFDVVSLSLQREIADENYMEYFLSGYLSYNDNIYEITTNIYQTEGLKSIQKNTFKGEDIFTLIDEVSIWIKKSLSIPDDHLNEIVDMPASELLTTSLSAYENYVKGKWNVWTANESIKYLEEAVRIDNEFAAAYFNLTFAYTSDGNNKTRVEMLEKVLELIYKIPESQRALPRVIYYFDTKQLDKAEVLLKRHIDKYPYDVNGYTFLGEIYNVQNKSKETVYIWNKVIELHKNVLQKNPDVTELLLRIGWVAMYNLGDYELSLDAYDQYLKIFPDEVDVYDKIGAVHERMNNLKKAENAYKKGLTIDPDDINLMQNLIFVNEKLGIDRINELNKILTKCKSYPDSTSIYWAMYRLNNEYGKINESSNNMEELITISEKYRSKASTIYAHNNIALNYGLLGDFDKALNIMNEQAASIEFPNNLNIKAHIVNLIVRCEKWELLKDYRPFIEELVEYLPIAYTELFTIDALIAEHIEKNYKKALDLNSKYLEEENAYRSSAVYISKAGCYRKMKKYDKALDVLNQLSKSSKRNKFNANYEYAMLYKDLNDYDKALKHIDMYLDHYKNADRDYILLNKGLALKEILLQFN